MNLDFASSFSWLEFAALVTEHEGLLVFIPFAFMDSYRESIVSGSLFLNPSNCFHVELDTSPCDYVNLDVFVFAFLCRNSRH